MRENPKSFQRMVQSAPAKQNLRKRFNLCKPHPKNLLTMSVEPMEIDHIRSQ